MNSGHDAPELPETHYLDNRIFTDEGIFAEEMRRIFAKTWLFVCHEGEIADTGDFRTTSAGGKPIVVVRDDDGTVRAFYNVCRHRSLKLVSKPHNCKSLITCPYHRWSYNLDGELRAAPFFGGQKTELPEDFKLEDHGLIEVPCRLFQDWLFVNLNGDTASFESYLAPLEKQLTGFDLDGFIAVASIEFTEIKTNWKFLMENFIEPYHVQFVHKKTTSQPLVEHYTICDGHCLGSGVNLSAGQQVKAQEGTLAVSSRYLTLFPNFVLGIYYPDQIGVHLNRPISAGTTSQRRVIYLHKDSDQNPETVENIRRLWENVHKEDHEICERLQEGRHSEVAEQGGILSPHWESSVRRFQELVANSIRPALNKNSLQEKNND